MEFSLRPKGERPQESHELEKWVLDELETLKTRVHAVERELGLPPAEALRPASEVPRIHNILRGLGLDLTAVENVLASPSLIIPANTKDYACPLDDCSKSYKEPLELHKHIRNSEGRVHRLVRDFIDQRTCPYCPLLGFVNSGDLFKHEKLFHYDRYHTRLSKILPHFGLYPR
jgi:hypothetical protein